MNILNTWWGNGLLIGGALGILLLLSVLPLGFTGLLKRLLANCLGGVTVLIAVNLFTVWWGPGLPLNALTLGAAAVLGGPGIIALVVIAALPG